MHNRNIAGYAGHCLYMFVFICCPAGCFTN
jgi:hypothetical protein